MREVSPLGKDKTPAREIVVGKNATNTANKLNRTTDSRNLIADDDGEESLNESDYSIV